eukprot:1250865-Pyramimonas_sp.AAC.1
MELSSPARFRRLRTFGWRAELSGGKRCLLTLVGGDAAIARVAVLTPDRRTFTDPTVRVARPGSGPVSVGLRRGKHTLAQTNNNTHTHTNSECGGKMHMAERMWAHAHTDFFEAFKNYDE